MRPPSAVLPPAPCFRHLPTRQQEPTMNPEVQQRIEDLSHRLLSIRRYL
jgi:hypothetical protein